MKIAIINRFSSKKSDYKFLGNYDDLVVDFYTLEKYKSEFDSFTSISGFKNENFNNVIIDIFQKHQTERFDRIITTNEFDIEIGGQLRELLCIKGQGKESSEQFRDKLIMKQKLLNVVSLPNFSSVDSIVDIIAFIDAYNFPVVLKPRKSAGSMGVKILRNWEDVQNLNDEDFSDLIIESYIEGNLYHLDGLYSDKDGLIICSISQYLSDCLAHQAGNYVGSFMIDSSSELAGILKTDLEKVLNKLATPSNPIAYHCEFFIRNGEPVFCEIASRIGGGLILESLIETYGINLLEESIKYEVEENYCPDYKRRDKYTGFVIIPPKIGKLVQVSLANFEWVKHVNFNNKNIGAEYKKINTSVSSVVSYLVEGQSPEQVLNRIEQLINWQERNIQWEPFN